MVDTSINWEALLPNIDAYIPSLPLVNLPLITLPTVDIPTAKISSNSALVNKKSNWIDFNAGQLLEGKSMPVLADEFLDFVLKIASGEIEAKSEKLDKHELSIFKDGVVL